MTRWPMELNSRLFSLPASPFAHDAFVAHFITGSFTTLALLLEKNYCHAASQLILLKSLLSPMRNGYQHLLSYIQAQQQR